MGDWPSWLTAGGTLVSVWYSRSAQRAAALVQGALRDAGINAEEATAKIESDPRTEEIVTALIDQATRTAFAEKRRLLRAMLTASLTAEADTTLDQLHFLVRAIERLDHPHLLALGLIEGPRHQPGQLGHTYGVVDAGQLRELWPGGRGLYAPVMAALEAEGMVEQAPNNAPIQPIRQWSVTELGRELLRYVRQGESIDLSDTENA